ncbi:MAG TPA: porin [Allosphingosinicella sp.]|jgi:phosphate-selective porin OprO/OprP
MVGKAIAAALLASTLATPALADPTTAEIAAELAAMRAKIASLEAQLAALRAAPEALAPAPPAPESRPAPKPAGSGGGVTVKPFGRLQYDVGHVESPRGVSDPGLGFGNELRRARLGVEGTIPGGFGYKLEADFADNQVEITDAFFNYKAGKPLTLTLGQHNNFQSLEEVTSSRFLSFLERAAFTDAFGFERRVGLSGTFAQGDVIAQAGIFTDNIDDLSRTDENDAIGADARLVYAPKLGATQLHLGGSAHWRDSGDAAGTARYRQRPFVHTTDTRFLATPALAVEEETSYGLEAALINGPFHATGELHWLSAQTVPGATPTFFGGYAEAGFFLTGETRGYKGGRWDRTKVLKPLGDGGFGALQVNLRYDRLDLSDDGVVGGTQSGFLAGLLWIPQDHVRFLLNYGRLSYRDAAVPAAGGDRDYSVNVVGARAQVDF